MPTNVKFQILTVPDTLLIAYFSQTWKESQAKTYNRFFISSSELSLTKRYHPLSNGFMKSTFVLLHGT